MKQRKKVQTDRLARTEAVIVSSSLMKLNLMLKALDTAFPMSWYVVLPSSTCVPP